MYIILSFIFAWFVVQVIAPTPPFPSVHDRQGDDVYCFMWTMNNMIQQSLFSPETTRKLALIIEKKKPNLKGKLIDWDNGNTKQLAKMHAAYGATYMFEEMIQFSGHEYERLTGDPRSELQQYQKGTAGTDNFATHLFNKGDVAMSEAQALQIMTQPNFQAWHIHMHYYDGAKWDHEVSITRNNNDWWYLDPAFPLIDVNTPQSWGCTRYWDPDHMRSHYTDLQGPRRYLRDHPDNERWWKKKDCERLKKYGTTAVTYLGSRYLGSGANGRQAAMARFKQMFVGTNTRNLNDPTGNEWTGMFKFSWAMPVFKRIGADRLKYFKSRFDKDNNGDDLMKKSNKWLKWQIAILPGFVITEKKAEYHILYALSPKKKGFWVNGKTKSDANAGDKMTGYTCRVANGDPSTWNDKKVKEAYMAEWRREQRKCDSKFEKSGVNVNPTYWHEFRHGYTTDFLWEFQTLLLFDVTMVIALMCCCGILGVGGVFMYYKFNKVNQISKYSQSPRI